MFVTCWRFGSYSRCASLSKWPRDRFTTSYSRFGALHLFPMMAQSPVCRPQLILRAANDTCRRLHLGVIVRCARYLPNLRNVRGERETSDIAPPDHIADNHTKRRWRLAAALMSCVDTDNILKSRIDFSELPFSISGRRKLKYPPPSHTIWYPLGAPPRQKRSLNLAPNVWGEHYGYLGSSGTSMWKLVLRAVLKPI